MACSILLLIEHLVLHVPRYIRRVAGDSKYHGILLFRILKSLKNSNKKHGAYNRLRKLKLFFFGGGGGLNMLRTKSKTIFCMVLSIFWKILGREAKALPWSLRKSSKEFHVMVVHYNDNPRRSKCWQTERNSVTVSSGFRY